MSGRSKKKKQSHDPYWFWVTRPDYYLDENGEDWHGLDPDIETDTEGWWTCDQRTKRGDLIFLYRARIKKDIAYLIQAVSDAYDIRDDPYAREEGWKFGCGYRVLKKLQNPVTFQDLKKDEILCNWHAVKMQCQGKSFAITQEQWKRLNELIDKKNHGFEGAAKAAGKQNLGNVFYEYEIEDALVQDLGLLNRFGFDLELYKDPISGKPGRQFYCMGLGGRIDLLCFDRKKRQYVVIELKNVVASVNTIIQIEKDMDWVKNNVAKSAPVLGLVISRDTDFGFDNEIQKWDDLRSLDINQLGCG